MAREGAERGRTLWRTRDPSALKGLGMTPTGAGPGAAVPMGELPVRAAVLAWSENARFFDSDRFCMTGRRSG